VAGHGWRALALSWADMKRDGLLNLDNLSLFYDTIEIMGITNHRSGYYNKKCKGVV